MRARFLYRGGSHWTDSFSNLLYYSHPDYPLLLPASIARSWFYIGNETQSTPIAIAMLFMLATVGLLCASVSLLRSTTHGCLAGLVLLGTPFFSIHAAAQYADVPLGFYMLATLVLLSLAGDVEKSDRGLLALAGMMAGFSAWTKNEGSLFLCAVLVAFFGLSMFLKRHNYGWREIIPFTWFLLPILAVVFYFKTTLAPPNDLLHAQSLQTTIGKLVTPSRYKEVVRAFFDHSFQFGKWPWYVNVPFILAFFSLLVGIDVERQHWWVTVSCISALALIVTGIFFHLYHHAAPVGMAPEYFPRSFVLAALAKRYLHLFPDCQNARKCAEQRSGVINPADRQSRSTQASTDYICSLRR